MDQANQPVGTLDQHAADYKPEAWRAYTFAQLGQWVELLTLRAQHRESVEKRAKDLYDASNYLAMMQAKLDDLKGKV